jgi:cytochrome c
MALFFNTTTIKNATFALIGVCSLSACQPARETPERPIAPWAFRSVLDKKPRMLTLALDSACYVAYDLEACTLYKVWKGGVLMEGTAYTDKKNVQPTSWGTSYDSGSSDFHWIAEKGGSAAAHRIISKGYYFKDNQINLKYHMILSSGDTIRIEERPEFIRGKNEEPGLERTFTLSGVPDDVSISIQSGGQRQDLRNHSATVTTAYFEKLPPQSPPEPEEGYDHRGRYFMEKSDCMTCHEIDRQTVGPAFRQIAQKYPREKTATHYLMRKIREGGSGVWGTTPMNPHPDLGEGEIRQMLNYIFSLSPAAEMPFNLVSENTKTEDSAKKPRPGYGAPLEGVHPGFDLQTIRKNSFKPRVGGLAFLPDGRLLVTTWDTMGGVYMLDNVESDDTASITVTRIASGLAEPLGIEVVDGEIYVLQKHELTRLRDLDGDETIDEYEAICNSWGVTSDFHEFAFGLVYKDGYFYATLSMAMRLLSHERQHPDRGRTIKISKDGSYESINYGLRTPNGIGLGVDGELFVTDNQGEWTPANKLIHVKQGEFLGMQWGLPDGLEPPPPIAAPAIWLPQDEIGNSPTEPVLIHNGPYKGQMLHGDVTNGGIKRDFLEKIDGEYQGAVFRFTQGLEAGVNRICWGPDSALYIGGLGMVGGWSWKEKQYGLQKLKPNARLVFEMLAVRVKPNGFEIEFTEPLKAGQAINVSDILVQQWRYEGTSGYGGPKLDFEKLNIRKTEVSADRTRLYLDIDGLQEGRVVHFLLPETLVNENGESMWSGEAWYTLNRRP